MHPLEDPRWHIQFQSDYYSGYGSPINIGWYWVRPTPIVREFFVRSQTQWNRNHSKWDQDIMNNVLWRMISEESLASPASIVLNLTDYRTTMLFDWPATFIDEASIDTMNRDSVMVHYTMIFDLAKELVAKQFGHWLNATYYQKSPKILQSVNIAGTTNETLNQMALAVHLAKITGRSFMWPNAINHTCYNYTGGWNARPPFVIADIESVAGTVQWVEGTYLRNRKRYTNDTLRSTEISINQVLNLQPNSLATLIERCLSASEDVLIVDFQGIDWKKLGNLASVRDIIQDVGLKKCVKCDAMDKYSHFKVVGCL
jgi:hypothetical protein